MWVSLTVTGVIVLALGAAYTVFRTPLVEVKHVVVLGAVRLADETVLERTDLLGKNMLTLDSGPSYDAIARLPLVQEVSIVRAWPNTVRIILREREPWGVWEQAGVSHPIDREGVVLGAVEAPADGPRIISASLATLRPGDRVDPEAIRAVIEIAELLPAALGSQVAEVAFVPGKGVQVTTTDEQVGVLGDSTGIAYKLAVWAAAIIEAEEERVSYTVIDLRFGNRPVLQ